MTKIAERIPPAFASFIVALGPPNLLASIGHPLIPCSATLGVTLVPDVALILVQVRPVVTYRITRLSLFHLADPGH